jgi:transposase
LNDILDIEKLIQHLIKEVREVREENLSLRAENLDLREQLSRYQHPKDSHNSNLPSSKDPIGKKHINLRRSTGRSTGGQPGHPGKTLEMQVPDKIEVLCANYCRCCGADLSFVAGDLLESRQQIDLPPLRPVVTEYRTLRKVCSCCHVNEGAFPATVTSSIGYGPGVESLVTYLSVCQHIPFQRLKTVLNEVFNLSVSEGTIHNILKRMEHSSYPAYEYIRKKLSESPVVGVDETGISVNGKTSWAWVWQNPQLTYLTAGHSRKKEVFTQIMPQGMPRSVLVTDCYSTYFNLEAKHHQICTSHILRELTYLSELYDKHPWSENLLILIRDALQLKKSCFGIIQTQAIQQKFQILMDEAIDKNYAKIKSLQKRLIKYRDYLFYFLLNENVPPDNNASERAIRVFKIKLKVSGFFKSKTGAQCFAQLHSIADTARKNAQSPLIAFKTAAIT